jgi:hypothetical protein
MKYFFITFCLIFPVGIRSHSFSSNSAGLSIQINLIKEYFVPHSRPTDYIPANDSIKEKRFEIQVSLTNNSDSAISFWLMSCSWEDNFLINNTYIYFAGKDCDKNAPEIVTIKSKATILLTTTLNRATMWDNPCQNCIGQISNVRTTKIGLIYIDKEHCKGLFDYLNISGDKSLWNTIIWSNLLNLSK